MTMLPSLALLAAIAPAPDDDAQRCADPCVGVIADESALAIDVAVQLRGNPAALAGQPAPQHDRAAVDAVVAAARASAIDIVVWLRRDVDGVRMAMLEVASARLFERRIETVDPAGGAEMLAVIIARAIAAIADGEAVPPGFVAIALEHVQRVDAAVATEPTPPAREPPPHRLRILAAYVGESWAREVAWHSGAQLGLGYRAPIGVLLGVSTRVMAPVRVRDPQLSLELWRHPLELAIGYGLRRRRLAVDAEALALLDIISARSESRDPELVARDSLRVDGGVGARVHVGVRAPSWLVARLGVGFDAFPAAFPYAVSRDGGVDTLVRARRVRPVVTLGLAFEPPLRRRRAH